VRIIGKTLASTIAASRFESVLQFLLPEGSKVPCFNKRERERERERDYDETKPNLNLFGELMQG